eukprot:COSAG01_NODE_6819_length_3483_cov_24.232565_2_plen_87_part_00
MLGARRKSLLSPLLTFEVSRPYSRTAARPAALGLSPWQASQPTGAGALTLTGITRAAGVTCSITQTAVSPGQCIHEWLWEGGHVIF